MSNRTGSNALGGFLSRRSAQADDSAVEPEVPESETPATKTPTETPSVQQSTASSVATPETRERSEVEKPTKAKKSQEAKKPVGLSAQDTAQNSPRVPLNTDVPATLRAEIMRAIYYLVPRTTVREAAEEAWSLWLERKIAERGEPFPEIPTGERIPTGRPPKW